MTAILPEAILIAAVSFNAVLSIVNGHVLGLARAHVVIAEMLIYGASLAVIVANADRRMWPWLFLTLFILTAGFFISLGGGELNAKYVRDVLAIPVFIMLGMTYRADTMARPFLIIHSIVFVVTAIEIASPSVYAETFRILDYYVNTRDFAANSFWNSESTLFVSATRPGARFFGFVDWHRASSIFLEPVSLGNYCAVAAILVVTCWREVGLGTRFYLIASTFFVLVASDGRLAAASIVIILVSLAVLRYVPSRWSVLYLPAVILASSVYASLAGVSDGYDNFVGRVAGTIDVLSQLNFFDLLGMNARSAEMAADNGIVYFILSQSLLGVVVIWGAISLLAPDRTPASRNFIHGVLLFIPLNLMVSYSFFSIKVASLIWFFYGFFYMKNFELEEELAGADTTAALV